MPPTRNPYPLRPFPRPPPASRADILPSSPVPRLPTRPRRRQPTPARLNPHPYRPPHLRAVNRGILPTRLAAGRCRPLPRCDTGIPNTRWCGKTGGNRQPALPYDEVSPQARTALRVSRRQRRPRRAWPARVIAFDDTRCGLIWDPAAG